MIEVRKFVLTKKELNDINDIVVNVKDLLMSLVAIVDCGKVPCSRRCPFYVKESKRCFLVLTKHLFYEKLNDINQIALDNSALEAKGVDKFEEDNI